MPQYYHAGISYDENSARIDSSKASFASLPGELRNLTYAATLKYPNPIIVTFDAASQRFGVTDSKAKHAGGRTPLQDPIMITFDIARQCIKVIGPKEKYAGGRSPLQALELLSILDRNIQTEARSYFFANNTFQIETKQTISTDANYIETYVRFIEEIGEVGRCSLRHLHLTVTGDSKVHRPNLDMARELWNSIAKCTNLVSLDIYADIEYFYMDRQAALRKYLSTEGFPIKKTWQHLYASIKQLPQLKRLILRPVFSSHWHYIEAIPPFMPSGIKPVSVRLQVCRPYEEAALLVNQIRGSMRREFRGSVNVRVLQTETWSTYGADLVFGKRYEDSEDWRLVHLGRYKPPYRAFNYSNGLGGRYSR